MKTLKSITLTGSRQGRATNWLVWPSFVRADFTDGTSRHYPESGAVTGTLATLRAEGVDCSAYDLAREEWEKAHGLPPIPEGAELYQHNYGNEKPIALGRWEWSTTFGRWSRLVTFADGWHGFTYPSTRSTP